MVGSTRQNGSRVRSRLGPVGLGLIALSLLAAPAPSRGEGPALTLARDGRPTSAIVLAAQPTRAAQFAAYELQWHLQQMTGAEVPLLRGEQAVSGVRLLVGESAATRALGIRAEDLGPQEYLVRYLPDTLVLMGRDEVDLGEVDYDWLTNPSAVRTWPGFWSAKATTYAVYDFLEQCGVRWFNPTETGTVIPHHPTLTVSGEDVRRAPFFSYRGDGSPLVYGSTENYDQETGLLRRYTEAFRDYERLAYPQYVERWFQNWDARRAVVNLFLYRMRLGGEKCFANHSQGPLYDRFWDENSPTFIEKRPDWFAQGYQGRPPNPCFTHPEVIQQTIEDARYYFDHGGYPEPGYSGTRSGPTWGPNCFALEPEDTAAFCQCERCQALMREPDPVPFFSTGHHSDYWFSFVNRVAQEVKQTHPDKRIVTLAYMSHTVLPRQLSLDPDVAVMFCFTNNSMPWQTEEYAHELELLEAWRAESPERPLSLWLYSQHWRYRALVSLQYPNMFYAFPAFNARVYAEQFRLFERLNLQGAFFCGLGQELEAYVTYKMMDNPGLDVETLLDEYFTALYGAAAPALRRFHDTMEDIVHRHWPEDAPVFQDEVMAWEKLGTAERMELLASFIREAEEAADSPTAQTNVQLFRRGIWEPMLAGRHTYLAHEARHHRPAAPLYVPQLAAPVEGGDVDQVDFSEAALLEEWQTEWGAVSDRPLQARLIHDGHYLYLHLQEQITEDRPAADDAWKFLFSLQRKRPFASVTIGPEGECSTFIAGDWLTRHRTVPAAATVRESTALGNEGPVALQVTRVAFPLDQLQPGLPVEPGWTLFANLVRHSPSGEHALWSPNVVDDENPTYLVPLHLLLNPDAPAVAAQPPDPEQQETPLRLAENALVQKVTLAGLDLATDDALQGKPFELDSPGTYYYYLGEYHQTGMQGPVDQLALTNALTPRAPTFDLMAQNHPGEHEIILRWELGPSPAEGRRLQELRLWWTMFDWHRNGAKVKFAVRDEQTGVWRDLTDLFVFERQPPEDNTFRVLIVDFRGQDITDFDALRLLADAQEFSLARLVELDMFNAPR